MIISALSTSRERYRWYAFSLIELLVTVALSAAAITVSVMLYQGLLASGSIRSSYGTVDVGSALANFYNTSTSTSLDVYFAPNYGRAAQAEIVRDRFIADIQRASAVFCLGRNGLSSVRPTTIPISSTLRASSVDTPEAFRQLLGTALPATASTFTAYRGACTATNASVFILTSSQDATALSVLSIYEIDLVPTTSPAGTYASVRRYETGTLTDYYDIFYHASVGSFPFNPLVVAFERATRRTLVEGDAIDRLKYAAERPFYLMWWPDPAVPTLEAFSAPTYSSNDPRASYPSMGGCTAFFFVVPMFPAL